MPELLRGAQEHQMDAYTAMLVRGIEVLVDEKHGEGKPDVCIYLKSGGVFKSVLHIDFDPYTEMAEITYNMISQVNSVIDLKRTALFPMSEISCVLLNAVDS